MDLAGQFRRSPKFLFERRACSERMQNVCCTNHLDRSVSFSPHFRPKNSFFELLRPQKFKNTNFRPNNSFFELLRPQKFKNTNSFLKTRENEYKKLKLRDFHLAIHETSMQKSISKETHFYKLKITSKISRSHF